MRWTQSIPSSSPMVSHNLQSCFVKMYRGDLYVVRVARRCYVADLYLKTDVRIENPSWVYYALKISDVKTKVIDLGKCRMDCRK